MTQQKKQQSLTDAIAQMQDGLMHSWVDRSLPDGWNYLNSKDPIEPHKTRVTLRMDTDMLKWFRKMGLGYQRRINQVLRVYFTAVLAGELQTHYAADDQTERRIDYYERMGRIMAQMTEDMEAFEKGGPLPRDPREYEG